MTSTSRDIYLVIGGSGFLGRHIVEQLLQRGDNVSVFDIVQKYHDTPFYSGDISEQEQVAVALRKSGTTCIIHTASPPATIKDKNVFWKVNVDGTKAVIAAAVETGVKKLVYTSSAGVVFDGLTEIVDLDERAVAPVDTLDDYNLSKLRAEETVLAANGQGGLLTVAIRPAGIFGIGDTQMMPGFFKVYQQGQSHFQIGDNNNLFDYTYVGNVAYAHILAADKLTTPPPAPPLGPLDRIPDEPPQLTEAEHDIINYSLSPIDKTLGHRRIPTSSARPLGPYVEYPPNGDKIAAAFAQDLPDVSRPVARTRFDQLSEPALALAKIREPEKTPLAVSGQVFFISGGEPVYFWDFANLLYHKLDLAFPGMRKPRRKIVLPRAIGLMFASVSEWVGWVIGIEPGLTRYKVAYGSINRWHNIEKARRVLGYEPQVGVEEGLDRMVEWWVRVYKDGTAPKAH